MSVTFKAHISHITNKDGTRTVFVRITQNRIIRRVNTGIRVHKKVWNPNPRDPGTGLKEYVKKEHLNAQEYNKRIFALIKKGEAAISEAEERGETLHIDQIKEAMEDSASETKVISFTNWALAQIDIEYPEKENRTLNRRYKTAIDLLTEYHKKEHHKNDVKFFELNLNFIKGFANYLKALPKAPGYINKDTGHINTLIKSAIIHKAYKKTNPFTYYKKLPNPKRVQPVLSLSEIHMLENLKLSGLTDQARDIFLWQLYMGGARNGDALFCRIEDIHTYIDEDGKEQLRWEYWTRKSKKESQSRFLSVMLTPKAMAIYQKRKGNRDIGFLFNYLPEGLPNIHTNEINDITHNETIKINYQLRKLAKRIGRTEQLTTHVARYTFSNIAEGNIEAISTVMGHGSIQMTEKYRNLLEQRKMDEVLKATSNKLFNHEKK